ncbi:cuticle collagen 6 (Protein roller-8) [Aphelenchoides avenae]|nr:cuticle collagen 6 (Protein roller-8) [Aphelenchus avenae]
MHPIVQLLHGAGMKPFVNDDNEPAKSLQSNATSASKSAESLMTDEEHRRLRMVTFFAVAVSTVALLVAVITLPLMYTYAQSLQSRISTEIDYCKLKSRDMWTEVYTIQDSLTSQKTSRSARRPRSASEEASVRIKRDWLFGKWLVNNGRSARSKAAGSETIVPSGYGRNTDAKQQASDGYGTPAPPAYDNTAAVTEFEQCKYDTFFPALLPVHAGLNENGFEG